MSQMIKELVKNLFHVKGAGTVVDAGRSVEKRAAQPGSVKLPADAFEHIIESLPIMYYALDIEPPHRLLHLSSAFNAFGYSLDEWRNDRQLWIRSLYHEDKSAVLAEIERSISGLAGFDLEYRVVGKEGEIFWVRNKGCPVKNRSNEVICWQGIVIDITLQKNNENEITAREGLYRSIARNLPNTGIILFDRNLRFTLADGEGLEKLGLTPKMIEGKKLSDVFPKEIAEKWEKYFKCVLAGAFISIEGEHLGAIYHNYILPLKNEKNEIYGGMSMWQDISEIKRQNEKIRDSEERYREIFDGANDLIYVHDLKGNYLSMNKAAEKVFGYTPEEILKLDMTKVIAPDQLDLARQMMQKKLQNRKARQTVYELDCLTKNGRRITLEINSSLIFKNGKAVAVQGIARDITERKQMQEALVESEERLRNLFDNTNDLIYMLDVEGRVIASNRALEEVLGYRHDELLNTHFSEVVAPEYLEFVNELVQEKLNGVTRTVFEVVCVTKKGEKVLFEVNSAPMYKNDRIVGIQGIARDITQRKLADLRIQQSEAELKALFHSMNDLVLVFDDEGRYLKIAPTTNPSLLYMPADELIGKKLHEIFPKEKADYFLKNFRRALKKKESVRIEYSLTIDGEEKWFSAIISPLSADKIVIVTRDVTSEKLSEKVLRENEEKYRDLFENANDLIYTIDLNGNFTSLNRTGEQISGYMRKEAVSGKINISQIVAPEYLAMARQRMAEKLAGQASTTYELEIITKNGQRVPIELNTRIIYRDGKPVGFQGIGRDISDRKRNEEALKRSESQYRLLSEGIMHQVWTATPDGMLDYVNGRVLEYFGKTQEELLNDGWVAVVHSEDLPQCLEKWSRSLRTGELYDTEFRLRGADGVYRWHRALATAGRDENGRIVEWFGTNTDIHDQKLAESQLSHFAKHDSLTNLPNRAKFMTHLERIVKRTEFVKDFRFAVLFLDLDRFKLINDSLGHLIGDKLLVAFSERLESCVRPGDIVARLGGDEFTVLLNNLEDPDDAVRVAERLSQSLTKPFKINDYEVFTSASIGIVVSDKIARQPEDYLRDADTAMYRAKEAGKARYEIFNSNMHVRNMTLLKIETDLRRALERNEFRVFYQPIVSLETGEIREFEALIRWQHPEHGLVEPSEFMEVAEETGLIIPIGKWVIDEACRQNMRWLRRFPQSRNFMVSVNLSAKQLLHPNLIGQIRETLQRTKMKPSCLRLEVTESVVMGNGDKSLDVLNSLKKLGVSLSTDDFGTGFSSLSYLQRFPFDTLKVDRSFIGQMDKNGKSAEIVRTILMLASNLNLEAVAEGIENEQQLKQLQILGCKLGQGYFFAKPVDARGVDRLLTQKSTEFLNFIPYELSGEVIESPEVH